jgi:hypothetical protein
LPKKKERKERKMTETQKESSLYKELKRLRDTIYELKRISVVLNKELDLYYTDLIFLYEHQAEIKEYFPADMLLWQWAGIDETETKGA